MGINRRGFISALGVTGLALATGKAYASGSHRNPKVEFNGILIDSTRCMGCRSCEYACAESHGLQEPASEVELIRQTDERCNTVVNTFTLESGEKYLKRQCMHCNEPACAAACLTKAMYKTEVGPVTWDGSKCMGCRYCMISCPFDSPKFEYHSANPKIQKCDMCFAKLNEGLIPACAENCPNEAITFGKRRDLIKEGRKRIIENPELYKDHIYGEHEAGGTGILYLADVNFDELGLKVQLQNSSYPALTKGFLYSVPSVFVLVPTLLLGIFQATKRNNLNQNSDDE